MVRDIIRKGVINATRASHADLWYDATNKTWGFIGDGASTGGSIATGVEANSIFEPLPLYTANPTLQLYYQASAAEVRQWACIGDVATKETIVAATKYSIAIRQESKRYEKAPKDFKYNFTSATTLSGTAATDRANVYKGLKTAMSKYKDNNISTYQLIYLVFTTGGTAVPVTGTTLMTQGTSGATGYLMSVTLTGGSWGGGDAAGHVWIAVVSGTATATTDTWTWTASGTLTGVISGTDLWSGLAMRDDAYYYSSDVSRGGKTEYTLGGFTTDVIDTTVAAVYAFGIGTDMLAVNRAAQFDLMKEDIYLGDPENIFDVPVLGGSTYTLLCITFQASSETTDGEVEYFRKFYYVWIEEVSTYTSTLITYLTTYPGIAAINGIPYVA